MIIIPVKEGESIDRALKKYKRKFEKTGIVKELRNRQKFPYVRKHYFVSHEIQFSDGQPDIGQSCSKIRATA